MKKIILGLSLSFYALSGTAHVPDFNEKELTPIFADLNLLKSLNIPVLFSDDESQLGYTVATGGMLQKLSEKAHLNGRCGNFEALPEVPQNLNEVQQSFVSVKKQILKNQNYDKLSFGQISINKNPAIVEALNELKSDNLKETVTWLSSYPTRYHKGAAANDHVLEFSNRLKNLVAQASYPIRVELVNHVKTPQKSIRVRLNGKERPNEIIVLGGHLDSTSGWFGTGKAPGADDNASGSASLLEALRVLVGKSQPARSIEFMWYAGEEAGLLGSAEIAETYKNEKKNVIAVLQLDMTLFPGDGVFKITSMTDFTSAWLRDYLRNINQTYMNIEILEDQCGYGCSDHASWFRRGFPTLMPTEAKFNSSFKSIHTERDVITSAMSFEHSLIFSKIALIMAMDLGNSNDKEPTTFF